MSDLDLDALEAVAEAATYWWDKSQDYPEVDEHIATFTPATVKALIARCRAAEALLDMMPVEFEPEDDE